MVSRFIAILLTLNLCSALWAAKPKKRVKGPAAEKVEKEATATKPAAALKKDDAETDEKTGVADATKKVQVLASGDEMEAYRQVQNREIVIVQDLADLLLMYQGEFAKYKTSEKRFQRARELGFLTPDCEATDELTIGLLAKALVKKYDPEKGWLYWLTGWERYALRDAQEAGMIPQKASPSQRISGEQFFAIMTDAEEFATKRSAWEKGE